MKTLAVFDKKDYDESFSRVVRSAARAIILKDGKVAMLYQGATGMCLFPGGGIEAGETNTDALIREVKEEAGLVVIPQSVKEFGLIVDIKKDLRGANGIYEMRDYYYTCDVEAAAVKQSLTLEEQEKDYRVVFVSLSEAICANEEFMRRENVYWPETAVYVLKLLNEEV